MLVRGEIYASETFGDLPWLAHRPELDLLDYQ